MSISSSMSSRPDAGAVVVAAGKGTRMGGELKQFREVGGIPMALRAIRPFLANPSFRQVVVVISADLIDRPPSWLVPSDDLPIKLVPGGAERVDSVLAGVEALDRDLEIAVIHDAARPFPDPTVIEEVVRVARGGRSAIAAIPVTDTLKLSVPGAGDRSWVGQTVSRAGMWRAQTPQGFPRSLLIEALRRAAASGQPVTDDASAVEELGGTVVLVPDRVTNLKITHPDDVTVAEALAHWWEHGSVPHRG